MEAILYELGTLRIVRRLPVESPPPGWIWSIDMRRGFQLKSTSEDAGRAFYVEQKILHAQIMPADPRTAEPDDAVPLVSIDDGPTAQVIEPARRSAFVDEPEPPTAEELRRLFDD